jgi:hypothetical protein
MRVKDRNGLRVSSGGAIGPGRGGFGLSHAHGDGAGEAQGDVLGPELCRELGWALGSAL